MKIKNNHLNRPLFNLSTSKNALAIMIIAPLLNFLFGISTDLYTPSLPQIATYFHASEITSKQSISAFMLGFCIGCLLLGPLMDAYGRRKMIIYSLIGFVLMSLLAIVSQKAEQLTDVRLFQGVFIAAASIGSRILILDNFTGQRYVAGIIYTSFAYAAGPVIGPFLGGWLQFLYGWQSVFIAYAILASIVFILFFAFIKESSYEKKSFSLSRTVKEYWSMTNNKLFLSGALLLGITLFQLIGFSVFGSYFYSEKFHVSSVVFGESSLFLGLSYLIATLVNRLCTHYFSQKKLCCFGMYLLITAIIIYLIVGLTLELSIKTILFPNLLIVFSAGFIFPNVLGAALRIFPNNIGTATSAQSLLFMAVCTIISSIANRLEMHSLEAIAFFYSALVAVQMIAFFLYFIKIYSPSDHQA